MSQADSELWMKARQARDKLAAQFLDRPEVTLVDIGYNLDAASEEAAECITLRVHVRQSSAREALGLPAEIEGIPIHVVVADYKPE
jgi:hypothetical protein